MSAPPAALLLSICDDHRSQLTRHHLTCHILRGRDTRSMNNPCFHLTNHLPTVRGTFASSCLTLFHIQIAISPHATAALSCHPAKKTNRNRAQTPTKACSIISVVQRHSDSRASTRDFLQLTWQTAAFIQSRGQLSPMSPTHNIGVLIRVWPTDMPERNARPTSIGPRPTYQADSSIWFAR